MAEEHTTIDTPEGIAFARLITLKHGLKLEMRGLRLTRGRTCYSILKSMGYKGSRQTVLDKVTEDTKIQK